MEPAESYLLPLDCHVLYRATYRAGITSATGPFDDQFGIVQSDAEAHGLVRRSRTRREPIASSSTSYS
jgi:hypothetical protein